MDIFQNFIGFRRDGVFYKVVAVTSDDQGPLYKVRALSEGDAQTFLEAARKRFTSLKVEEGPGDRRIEIVTTAPGLRTTAD